MFNSYKAKIIALELLSNLKVIGCQFAGEHTSGNSILKLNKKSPLGLKGDLIFMPKDEVMYRNVKFFGKWELEESLFLASAVKNLKNSTSDVTLIDIGANCGLTSIQVMNLLRGNKEKSQLNFILVEPLDIHLKALKENLKKFESNNITIFPYALSVGDSGESEIYTESKNFGNTSMISNVVNQKSRKIELIKTKEVNEFIKEELSLRSDIVIKIDIQGLDVLILNEFKSLIPDLIKAVIVEVWAIPSISKLSVDNLRNYISSFEYCAWTPFNGEKISFDEIFEFWTSQTGKTKNLFLSKSAINRI